MVEKEPEERLVDDRRMPRVGQSIVDRYEITRVLGEGGFGAVYHGIDRKLDGEVAIKVLDPEKSLKRSFIDRFNQEIRLTRKLRHPNTIKIWDAGVTETGCLYMAMEYVVGRTLADELKKTGGMPIRRIVAIINQVLKSLSEAHKLGVIHRDLKPANIMLCELEGEVDYVKVLDFGIAKALSPDLGGIKTATGLVLCTPTYASPELLRSTTITLAGAPSS